MPPPALVACPILGIKNTISPTLPNVEVKSKAKPQSKIDRVMAEETNHNEAGEVAPSTVEKQAPDVAEEHAPSTDSPEATDIPTANAPDPTAVNPETNPNAVEAKKPAAERKAAKAAADEEGTAAKKPAGKKEKAPGVEEKPFGEFISQDYLPALKAGLAKKGAQDLDLKFVKQKIPILGFSQEPECWQVVGNWHGGSRQFRIYFFGEDIQGKRGFSYSENGDRPSTLEPFLIDEKKVSLDLLVFGVVQRLTAQKWLVRN